MTTTITHAIALLNLDGTRYRSCSADRAAYIADPMLSIKMGGYVVCGFTKEEAERKAARLNDGAFRHLRYVPQPLWSRPVVTEVTKAPKPKRQRASKASKQITAVILGAKDIEDEVLKRTGCSFDQDWHTPEGATRITLWKGDRVVGTALRKRRDESGPEWKLFDANGDRFQSALTYQGARGFLLKRVLKGQA